MNTRILFLPADPAASATCLDLADDGRVLSRAELSPGTVAPTSATAARTVLVVPGEAVRIDHIALKAHSAAQARAAAQAMLAERLARPASLHVALDAGAAGDARTVASVEPAALHEWLARAADFGLRPDAAVPEQLLLPADFGLRPDAAVPEQLLLPAPSDDVQAVHVLDAGERWLVRGPGLAFCATPALAAQVLAGREQLRLQGGLEACAARALHPDVDLLQGAFAPASAQAGKPRWRRLAWLAAALVASPLVLVAAQALRLELAAHALESRAGALVRDALPGNAGGDGVGADALARQLRAAREPRAFTAASGALFAAVAGRAGTHLVELDYLRGDRLRAVVFHAVADDIEAIRGALAADGWTLVEGGSSDVPGGLHTGLVLEPSS
ncbi:type II secretion system protein GspL [Luteimonas changyuni]|uniref:type II secretion system protein GspL n=1 Tax=Luteimonas sp. MJ145 TaxID=3129234 RepID=UPI0031BB10F2